MSFNSVSGCYKKSILVPLDGSSTAETALKFATELAPLLQAQLILVYIVSPLMITESSLYLYQLMDDILSRQCDDGWSCLARIAGQFEQDDLIIRPRVRIGERIQVILDEARECHAAMIVMEAERSSRFRRWLIGSEADELLQESTFPVVFINGVLPNPTKGVLSKNIIASSEGRSKVQPKANPSYS
jgi:nucleotide-binding universal stress UspA family protein